MGRGSDTAHTCIDDELGRLAGVALARVAPNRADSATGDDCYQAAYVAGLAARHSAHRAGKHTSSEILLKKMIDAIYRLLRQRAGRDLRESDLQICA